MTDERLKRLSFGVFAQQTGNTAWTDYAQTTTPFNFMWNQKVYYDTDHWTYTPVKYWPNDNRPADDQSPAAQGSQLHSYLSFFAYAPYVSVADPGTGFNVKDYDGDDADTKPDHDGIVQVVGNATNTNASFLYYRTSNEKPFDPDESVDLLWARETDRYKMDGGGYVNGHVDFLFKHALSLFTVTVQGLFDHKDNDDATTLYPDDRDPYTKILIESVDFSGSPIFTAGKMYVAPNPANSQVPHWECDPDLQYNLRVEHENINPTFTNRYLDGTWMKYWNEEAPASGFLRETDVDDNGTYDAGDARALFNELPMGVSHTEVPLDYTNWDPSANDGAGAFEYKYRMVLPNDEYRAAHSGEKMTVRMVYYVITYDQRLTLVNSGMPKYFSIVKNDITAVFDNFSFAPNKKYKLRLQPGVTSAKFEVTVVDGWDTPMTLDPEVVDWYTTTKEFNVE